MANTRIKDLTNTAVTVPSDAYIAIDGSANGTAKIGRDDLRQDTADAIAAAPSTYNLAPLTSGSVDVDKGGTGSTTADGAKTNLEIPNVGTAANEVSVNGMLGDLAFQSSAGVVVDDLTVDGELIAAVGKPMPVNGPTMRFDGVDDEIRLTASVGSPFSFTNGTDDTAFAVAGWCKLASGWNTDERTLLSKFEANGSLREWRVYIDTDYRIYAEKRGNGSISGNTNLLRTSSNALSDIDDKWVHICVVWLPAGPNSADAFTSAKAYIYVNGKLNVDVQSEQPDGPYVGMTDTSADVRIGARESHDYWDGEIRDVKLFNKELSAAEVKEVYSNGQLPESFAESTGGADGGVYTSDFSAGVDGTAAVNGSLAIASIGGQNNNLRFTSNAGSSYKKITKDNITLIGKKYKVVFDYYIPSSNSNIDGFAVADGGAFFSTAQTRSLDAWTMFEAEFVSTYDDLHIWPSDGTATTFDDSGGDDVFYVRNVRVTQIGSVLDARAEQFDTSTGKLYDLSGNSFVGTQSGGVSLLGREFPVYETGTWTPSVSFGGGSTGVAASIASGFYTRIGNLCHISCNLTLTSKGSDTGNAVITGLPFTAGSVSSQNGSIRAVYAANLAGLTSGIEGRTTESSTNITLQDWGTSGVSVLNNTNWNDNSAIRLSGTYQIQ